MNMLNQFYRINTASGIGLRISSDSSVSLNACKISVNGKQLDFETKVTGLKTIGELKGFDATPVSLNISGKGVLTKTVEAIEEITANNFSQILPNANFGDFYIQNFVSGDISYVSIIRKTEADKWISELQGIGCQVAMLSIGAFPASGIIPQLNFYDNEIRFDGHDIKTDEGGKWISYRLESSAKSAYPIKIESEAIDERLILAYAAAFQLLMNDRIDPVQANSESATKVLSDTLSNKWIRVFSSIAIVTLFCLLLINFVVNSYLNSENSKLSSQTSRLSKSTLDQRQVNEEIKSRELKLRQMGWRGNMSKAKLLDDLASVLPDGITWREVTINPNGAKHGSEQIATGFQDGKILIAGFSPQVMWVNEYMARIRTKAWVKAVNLENYGTNPDQGIGHFMISISY